MHLVLAPVSSAPAENNVMTCVALPRQTRKERRSAWMRPGAVVASALRAAMGARVPTAPRRVGRYVIDEVQGVLGGGGFGGNARVCLTCQAEVDARSRAIELVETRDPYDRAHAVTELSAKCERMLIPTARAAWRRSNSGKPERCAVAVPIPGAKPRRYPRSSMLQSGVSIDSAFDWLYEARRRLAGVPGVGVHDTSAYDVRAGLGEVRLRDLVRKKWRSGEGRSGKVAE